jgi:catechol 2,3-dioxygenase-like lactoylglutathione lyase family enzyme
MPKAVDVAYVVYEANDLERMETFMRDFGLVTARKSAGQLCMRGASPAPVVHVTRVGEAARFVGGAFKMASLGDLETLAGLPGSSGVEPIEDLPGGGWRVRMTTPDGVAVDGVWGQQEAAALPLRAPNPFNGGTVKTRINHSLRPKREPGLVLRFGHFGLRVSSHDESVRWMRERFGMLDSDYLCVPGDESQIIGTFLRFDRGEELVDHHTMLVVQSREPGVHHSSFEMQDIDALFGAHDYLLQRGYELECGPGRHLVGSQVFDYWRDPFGLLMEHYTDGDVSNIHYQAKRYAVAADETTQWGMQPPKTFFD